MSFHPRHQTLKLKRHIAPAVTSYGKYLLKKEPPLDGDVVLNCPVFIIKYPNLNYRVRFQEIPSSFGPAVLMLKVLELNNQKKKDLRCVDENNLYILNLLHKFWFKDSRSSAVLPPTSLSD